MSFGYSSPVDLSDCDPMTTAKRGNEIIERDLRKAIEEISADAWYEARFVKAEGEGTLREGYIIIKLDKEDKSPHAHIKALEKALQYYNEVMRRSHYLPYR